MNDRYVVTGGSSGAGAALVERLTRQALEIWVLDVRSPGPEAPFPHFIETDLSSRPSMDAALAALPDRIAGLANVAGIARGGSRERAGGEFSRLALSHRSAHGA